MPANERCSEEEKGTICDKFEISIWKQWPVNVCAIWWVNQCDDHVERPKYARLEKLVAQFIIAGTTHDTFWWRGKTRLRTRLENTPLRQTDKLQFVRDIQVRVASPLVGYNQPDIQNARMFNLCSANPSEDRDTRLRAGFLNNESDQINKESAWTRVERVSKWLTNCRRTLFVYTIECSRASIRTRNSSRSAVRQSKLITNQLIHEIESKNCQKSFDNWVTKPEKALSLIALNKTECKRDSLSLPLSHSLIRLAEWLKTEILIRFSKAREYFLLKSEI